MKEKAKVYLNRSKDIFTKNKRKPFLSQCTTLQIFTEIDAALQVQKMINAVSDVYEDNNRTVGLIINIFSGLLKTYLFCYSIVSIGVLCLFGTCEII